MHLNDAISQFHLNTSLSIESSEFFLDAAY